MSGICANVLDTMWQALYAMLMERRLHHFSALVVSTVFLAVFLAGCAGKSNPSRDLDAAQSLVDSATQTLRDTLEGERKLEVSQLIARAKGVLVVPAMSNVSLIVSVGGGSGVMLARTGSGWNGPVFLSKGTGGLGMQAGLTKTTGIILYMAEEDVRYVLETGAVLQGRARVTFLDADYQGNQTPEFFEAGDVVFVGSTSGLYAGVGLQGGGLSDRPDLNAAYHGVKDGSPEQILFEKRDIPIGARHLVDLLDMAESYVRKAGEESVGD